MWKGEILFSLASIEVDNFDSYIESDIHQRNSLTNFYMQLIIIIFNLECKEEKRKVIQVVQRDLFSKSSQNDEYFEVLCPFQTIP